MWSLLLAVALAAEPLADPTGARLVRSVHAVGVQIYDCKAGPEGAAWAFRAPEATLYSPSNRRIGDHGAGPTWTLDRGGAVVGKVVAKADAPRADAVPWLLLTAASADGAFRRVTLIRRLDTVGGLAPATGCDAATVGAEVRVAYEANYRFYAPRGPAP